MSRSSIHNEHIALLDQVRGIAIVLVFAYHALGATFGMDQLKWQGWSRDFNAPGSFLVLLPLTMGWGGVAIFFVVSGFCIHLSYEKSSRKEFKVFFVRRFLRIYPPYFLALGFFAFLFPWSRLGWNSFHDFAQFGSHLLLVHNFHAQSLYGINAAFWSIAVEAQLYLLYPLMLLGVRRLGWGTTLWLIGFVEVVLRTFAGTFSMISERPLTTLITGSPLFFWFSWSIGAKIAADLLEGRPLFLGARPLWLWSAVAVISCFIKPLASFSFLFIALAAANGIARALGRPSIRVRGLQFLGNHLAWVGAVSYSFYLLHEPFVSIFPSLMRMVFPGYHFGSLLMFSCSLASYFLILPLSWLFYRLVELPSIAIGKWVVQMKMAPRQKMMPPELVSPPPALP